MDLGGRDPKDPQSQAVTALTRRRPKGLAPRIRELTNELDAEIRFLHDLASGAIPGASHKDRIQATQVLLDRGYGKAIETLAIGPMDDGQREAVAELTRDQLLSLVGAPVPMGLGSGREASQVAEIQSGAALLTISSQTGGTGAVQQDPQVTPRRPRGRPRKG